MFSGSFGVRSIVLCKSSGKYIDIYFILKITFLSLWDLGHYMWLSHFCWRLVSFIEDMVALNDYIFCFSFFQCSLFHLKYCIMSCDV